MPRFNSYSLPTTHAVAPATTTRVDLPRSGFITHIGHILQLNITTAGGATVLEDPFHRFIHATRIVAAGSKTFFTHGDGRLWKYLNHFRYLGQLDEDAIPAGAGGPANFLCYIPLHLGFDPLNIFDGKVVIPARDIQNITEEMVWGANADIGVAQTINVGANSFMRLTINEVALEPGESVAQFFPAGFLLPRFEYRSDLLTIQSNLGVVDNLPVGDTLFQTIQIVLAAAGTRSLLEADASEIGVKFPKVRETPMQVDINNYLRENRSLFSLPATLQGVSLFPWERISRDPFGLDLTKAQPGDVQLALTTVLGTGTWLRLHYALG